MSAHLVKALAKYAAGSGISEIKCILAGFVMHGFLGFSTFFVKTVTLVRALASHGAPLVDAADGMEKLASRHCLRLECREGGPERARGVLHWEPHFRDI